MQPGIESTSPARLARYRRGGVRRLGMATAAIVLLVSMASLGYWGLGQLHHSGVLEPRLEEPWSVIDCLYMTVVTISTIGYTETLPVGAEQSLADFTEVRVYTMGVILLALLHWFLIEI